MITEAERESFRQQFKEPIELLIARKQSEFALMMITLPLVERLLRGRFQLKDGSLSEPFYAGLCQLFPELREVKQARAFWQCFRHGILHPASFSLKRADRADFSGVIGLGELPVGSVAIHLAEQFEHIVCTVDPVAFAKTVLAEVERDLQTFYAADPEKHPIALNGNLSGGVYSFRIPLRGIETDEPPI